MFTSWLKYLTRSLAGVIFLILMLVIGILCLDVISPPQLAILPSIANADSRSLLIERYATKVSIYSLVRLDLVRYESIDESNPNRLGWNVNDNGYFYSCIGDVRRSSSGYFVDISALTLSIVATETYNRQFFRQAVEIYVQDLVNALGGRADYTIGLAQIKTSLALETYRANVNKTATDQEIKTFARSSCGSTHLASLLIEVYLDECSQKGLPLITFDDTIKCVVTKYTGLKEGSRLLAIYTRSVILSYNRLFDRSSEFYDRQFAAKLGVPQMYGGECIEFNPLRGQLRISPASLKDDNADTSGNSVNKPQKQRSQRVGHRRGQQLTPPPASRNDNPEVANDSGDDGAKQKSKKEQSNQQDEDITFAVDTDTILKFKKPEKKIAVVKIIPTTQELAHAADRERLIGKYICGRYQPDNVDYYPAFSFLPDSVRQFCEDDNEELKPASYIALILETGKSGEGGARSESCPTANKPPPVSVKPQPKQKR